MAVQNIVNNLKEIHTIYDKLIELGEEKQHLIVHNQVNELNQLVNREAKLIRQIAELEALRIELVGQFLIGKGYRPHPAVSISDIIKFVFHADEKLLLTKVHRELTDSLRKLKEINERNKKLIEHSLSFIDFSINLITGAPDDLTYQHPTQRNYAGNRAGLFDSRA